MTIEEKVLKYAWEEVGMSGDTCKKIIEVDGATYYDVYLKDVEDFPTGLPSYFKVKGEEISVTSIEETFAIMDLLPDE